MSSLRDVQRRFHELVTAPESVHKTLASRGSSVEELGRIIRGDGVLSAADRLDIYANMYFFRIRDVLRDDYPKVLALVGDDEFHNLATDYLAAHAPDHFSLRNAGKRLPDFIAGHRLSEQCSHLADLARLERERLEVFDAADAETLTMDELRARPPETFASLALELIPAHGTFETQFPVDEIWQALEDEQPPPAIAPQKTRFVVWRAEPMIYHRPLGDDEQALWPLLAGGVSFGVVCERLSERHPHEDVAPIAFQLLAAWVEEGLLRREEEEASDESD